MASNNNVFRMQTIGCIAGYPTGNAQGTWRHYWLKTGEIIDRNGGMTLPCPDVIIDRVHALADKDKQEDTFVITDMASNIYDPEEIIIDNIDNKSVLLNASEISQTEEPPGIMTKFRLKAKPNCQIPAMPNMQKVALRQNQSRVGTDETEAPTFRERKGYNLRKPKPRSYTHLHGDNYLIGRTSKHKLPPKLQQLRLNKRAKRRSKFEEYYNDLVRNDKDNPYFDARKNFANANHERYMNALATYNKPKDAVTLFINHVVLQQYGVKKGLKIFGEARVQAIEKEICQFNDREVIILIDPNTMNCEQRNRALSYLMFLKQKRDASIKACGCADGRKQRLWMQAPMPSPTVATETLFLSCMIDAKEGRDVATVDISGAFLQTPANKDEEMIIQLDRQMASALMRIDPDKYGPLILYEGKNNDIPVIYGKANKAIYGTLNASLLFWKNLSKYLIEHMGFTLNRYNQCVVNKIINGKQCTIF